MKRFRLIILVLMFLLLTGGIASATPLAPETISVFSFSPTTVTYGGITTLSTTFKTAASGNDNVLCIHYDDAGWTPLFIGPYVSTRGDVYIVGYAGPSSTAVQCVPIRANVAELVAAPTSFIVTFLDDTVSVPLTLPGMTPPVAGLHPFDVLQQEGVGCVAVPGSCVITSGGSASVTVVAPPTDAYVSNDSTCAGNTPCYTGSSALSSAIGAVTDGGTIFIVGTYSQGGATTATLSGSKSVSITGFNTPLFENGGGTCSGAMLENSGSGSLDFASVTVDGSCGAGSRSAGILNSGAGSTTVHDSLTTVRDFTGSGSGVSVSSGTLTVNAVGFSNNNRAMNQTGGTLHAFANNVPNNVGADAAVSSAGTSNVRCNYWGSATISGFGSDFDERLGAPVVGYTEGTGALTLGAASTTATGTQVIVNMGRGTPPFNNGTAAGLGAQVSDFFATCTTRGTASGAVTALSVDSDSVTAGPNGFRMYEIDSATACSPSTNTTCWKYLPTGSATNPGPGPITLTDGVPSEGHFMIGNEVDPTAVNLQSFNTVASGNLIILVVVATLLFAGGSVLLIRHRQQTG
ncbi:MAG: hypothetical protein GY796_29710 [Chloroflexi bacterium]|nr:hypothetical protein [Chloroflexota bacterium]